MKKKDLDEGNKLITQINKLENFLSKFKNPATYLGLKQRCIVAAVMDNRMTESRLDKVVLELDDEWDEINSFIIEVINRKINDLYKKFEAL